MGDYGFVDCTPYLKSEYSASFEMQPLSDAQLDVIADILFGYGDQEGDAHISCTGDWDGDEDLTEASDEAFDMMLEGCC